MSVQLILYPQNYEGQYSSISTPFFTEYVSDYSFNIGALGSGWSGTAGNAGAAISNLIPLNIWQQYNVTGGSFTTANAATVSSGKITLDSASSTSLTGIYQLISNLQIGSTYVLEVQRLAGTTGIVTIGHGGTWSVSGTTYNPLPYVVLPNTVGTHTFTFTATNTEQVFLLNYINDDNSNLEIGEVSIQENVSSAPTVDVFRDGQVICDLYEESNIPLSLSVDDFKNVAEKKQSFSKPFKLPATKRNNKIFTSLFDVTKSVKSDIFSFNPYKKTKAILKEDGYTIFDGYLRLIDISDKENEISYNINLYGDAITLKDTLKDKKFKNIDFSELNHDYNKTNIKLSHYDNDGVVLNTALPTSSFAYNATLGTSKTDVIKYPFVKWNGDTYLDTGNVKLQKLEDAFRPFINCKYLVDRIITEAGFTYNSDFLESTDFTKLFMDFNWGEGISPAFYNDVIKISADYTVPSGWSNIQYTTNQIPPHYNTSTKVFTADADNLTFSGYFSITVLHTGGANETLKMRWLHTDSSGTELNSGTVSHTIQDTGGVYPELRTKYFNVTLNDTDELRLQTWVSSGSSNLEIISYLSFPAFGISYQSECTVQTSSQVSMLEALNINRGELGQWDFLKGIMTMFNLLVIQDKDNPSNLIIEPYKSVFIDDTESQYITHKTLDWTSKVDISEMKLNPLKLKKKVLFDFVKEDKDYPLGVYKKTTGYKYGSQEIDASIFNLLEGETKIEAKPFGSTFIKPIFDGFTTEMTIPVIYTGKDDGTFEGYNNKPRILYNNGRVTMASNTYYIPPQNGLSSENQSSFGQFSHLTEIPTTQSTKDYNFNTGQLISSIGNTPIDNLYNTYWSDYYDELYNADTKEVKLKIYLTPADIANFEFYFTIRIKNKLYRVNKIEYKPYELSSVELILIG